MSDQSHSQTSGQHSKLPASETHTPNSNELHHEPNIETSESSYQTGHPAIRKARRFALQGLYEWLMTDHRFATMGQRAWQSNAPHDIAARTRATNAMHTVHLGYYHQMMRDIPEQIDSLNTIISQYLDRDISKLDMVEHSILLIGAYELHSQLQVPYKVVIDEAMKLNNHFGATDAHKLINAVLDKMAADLRPAEVSVKQVSAKQGAGKETATKSTTAEAPSGTEAATESAAANASHDQPQTETIEATQPSSD